MIKEYACYPVINNQNSPNSRYFNNGKFHIPTEILQSGEDLPPVALALKRGCLILLEFIDSKEGPPGR